MYFLSDCLNDSDNVPNHTGMQLPFNRDWDESVFEPYSLYYLQVKVGEIEEIIGYLRYDDKPAGSWYVLLLKC